MHSAELLALVRSQLKDEVEPYLWTDTVIYRYLDEAQRILAEKSYCLIDDENYTVDTEIGVRSYTIPSEILLVLAAKIIGETKPLSVGFTHVGDAFFSSDTGTPIRYSLVGGKGKISFSPTPDAAYSVQLVTAIRPTEQLGATNDPVVPEETHAALADYATSRCLYTNDVDGINTASAEAFGTAFNMAVREQRAKVYRYRFGPDANVIPPRI
jgi:hypothetical protein